jgi:beta-N-acetylhexosaminidase
MRWFVLLLALLVPLAVTTQTAVSQTPPQAEQILQEMTVEQRVGQLFLVPFLGDTITAENEIVELILDYNVGGVILLPENDNLTGYGNPALTPSQLVDLTSALQTLALEGTLPPDENGEVPATPTAEAELNALPPDANEGVPIPVFVAMNNEGEVGIGQQILGGFTALPTNMAIGATWNPERARAIGRINGQELAAVGVNMLLGPTLDVLENPEPRNPADLGTSTFGGDPYWVGKMGQAYTSGVHLGGQNRVAVIAKHFPGKGSSDRPTSDEVPTVRKSLEQLKQIELAPFVAVTGAAQTADATADGLLTTHIRYQGFQGNIRATTAPVSFDPQALTSLMSLPEFAAWREGGGLIVSDALGVRSVERFYDDTEQEFPHRRVAKDAFLAGNDVLYLGDFALGTAPYAERAANMKDTIVWFREKYVTDQSFQQHTDAAVLRIIERKLALYGGDWSPANVLATGDNLDDVVGNSDPVVFNLGQASTTLISPSLNELAERLASPPGFGDNIVVFTDVREVQQCSECPEGSIISRTAIADRLVALYGPEASNQISANQVASFSFADLGEFLDAGGAAFGLPTAAPTPTADSDATPQEEPTPFLTPTPSAGYLVQEALRDADWIVFGLLDGGPRTTALNRFLAERPDIVRNARVFVFALDAPYFLDTTEISKLTAYYGIYSPIDMFTDTAVRTLFMEAPLNGASPVSIPGIGYNLFTITQPDPQQILELYILQQDEVQSPPNQEALDAQIGETLRLQTGLIYDHNGNQVPDGTIVQFIQQDRILGTVTIVSEVATTNGVARLDYVLGASTGPGQFRITAASGEATLSQAVDISIADEAEVVIVIPTSMPTPTSTPSPTPTMTPEPTITPSPPPTNVPDPTPPPEEPAIRIALSELEMLLSMVTGLLLFSIAALFVGRGQADVQQRVGGLFWGLVGGLTAYIYALLQLPGSGWVLQLGTWAGLTTTILGAIAGWLLFQIIYSSKQPQKI